MKMNDCQMELIVKYWDNAFPEVIEHLRAPYGSENLGVYSRAPWARFLIKGLDFYRIANSRRRVLMDLVRSLSSPSGWDAWRSTFGNEPSLANELRTFLRAEADEDRALEYEVHATLRALDGMGSATGPLLPFRSVPGHIRTLLRPYGQEYEVEELVVTTIARSLRTAQRAEGLRRYSNATQPVDDILCGRFHKWAELPGDVESPNVTQVILTPVPLPIGDPESQQGGRSTDLATLVAALCFRYRWSLKHDRVVATGKIEAFPFTDESADQLRLQSLCHVSRVEYISEKLDAVVRWMKRQQYDQAGFPCVLLLPRGNASEAEDAMSAELRQWRELGYVVIQYVETLDEVLDALPIAQATGLQRRSIPVVDWSLALGTFLWWGERLWGGEYVTDHATRLMHPSCVAYAFISFGPAVLPALVLVMFPSTVQRQPRLS
jgi:hypothetical protein